MTRAMKVGMVVLAFSFGFTLNQINKAKTRHSVAAPQVVAEQAQVAAGGPSKTRSGAIDEAAAMLSRSEFLLDLAEEVGVECHRFYRGFGDRKACREFMERVAFDKALENALRYAKKKDVQVYFNGEFDIQHGFVGIDQDASNRDIVEFLMGN